MPSITFQRQMPQGIGPDGMAGAYVMNALSMDLRQRVLNHALTHSLRGYRRNLQGLPGHGHQPQEALLRDRQRQAPRTQEAAARPPHHAGRRTVPSDARHRRLRRDPRRALRPLFRGLPHPRQPGHPVHHAAADGPDP